MAGIRRRCWGERKVAEVALLEKASRHGRRYPAGHDLFREGDNPGLVIVVLEGWAIRYKLLPGGGRQIISFMMPGDFCDMHVAVLTAMDHSIATLTEATIVTLSAEQIEQLTEVHPTLVKVFWWTQLVDEGVLRSTIVSMGRRTSLERVAHLLYELCLRMLSIGIASAERCEMPFSQIVQADAVGLTPVHVNRVVGQPKRAGALDVTHATLIVANLTRLAGIAGFDDNYLHRRQSNLAAAVADVAVEPTVHSLIVLAGIVLIRTFLSFSLEVEIEGRWPWQKDGVRRGGAEGANPEAIRS